MTDRILPTRGHLAQVSVTDHVLSARGWTASSSGAVQALRVALGATPLSTVDVTRSQRGVVDGDTQPGPDDGEKRGFDLRLPLTSAQARAAHSLAVVVTPVLQEGDGRALVGLADPQVPMPGDEDAVAGVGALQFKPERIAISLDFLGMFVQLGRLLPTDAVLDVGCGAGRMAFALAHYLSGAGRYEGFDIIEQLVGWARDEITPRFPNFQFRTVPLYNDVYNPKGTVAPIDLAFPYPDASFDFAILTSVFTHMPADEVRHYLDELARVTRPGGRCFTTWFLIDRETEDLTRDGKAMFRFVHPIADGYTTDPRKPGLAIGFRNGAVRDWVADSGLVVDGAYLGDWSGRTGATPGQDILVLRKPG